MRRRAYLIAPLAIAVIAGAGCKSDRANDSKDPPAPVAEAGPSAAAGHDGAAAPAPERERPKMPPEARRNAPPKGMTKSALTAGTPAPELAQIASTAGTWSRGDGVTVLAFYRGHW